MRVFLAALFACLFVAMTVTDRFSCPDGCTDEAPMQTAAPHASAPCALCLGWDPPPAHSTPHPPDRLAADLPPLTARLLAPPLPTVERPPKAA
jgi:hypothetical protein